MVLNTTGKAHTNRSHTMSKATLLAALSEISGGTFIGLDTTTVPVLTGGKKTP